VLVTGSSGYLGAALCQHLKSHSPYHVVGIDVCPSLHTTHVGDISDGEFIQAIFEKYSSPKTTKDESEKEETKGTGIYGVVHTAALHKPHVATHTCHRFVAVNVTGTLNLLENSVRHSVQVFIFTSTTSLFISNVKPKNHTLWITEQSVLPPPKNIYALTKISGENLCHLFHQLHRLPILILRTSRFFPEEDDTPNSRINDENTKANEYLYRRVALQDVVEAHVLALEKAKALEFDTFIISAKTPFEEEDLSLLSKDFPSAVRKYFGTDFEETYEKLGWHMENAIDRVYVAKKAEEVLGFTPRYNFAEHLLALKEKAK